MKTLQRFAARQWPDAAGGWRDYRIDEDGSGAEDGAAFYDSSRDRGGLLRPATSGRKVKTPRQLPTQWRPANLNLNIDAAAAGEYSYDIGPPVTERKPAYAFEHFNVAIPSDSQPVAGTAPQRRMTVMLGVGRDLAQQFQHPLQKVQNMIKERFPSVGSLNSVTSLSASSLASPPPPAVACGSSGVRASPSSPSLFGTWSALRRGGPRKNPADLPASIGLTAEFSLDGQPQKEINSKIGRAQVKLNNVRNKFKSKHADSQNLLKFDQLNLEDHE